MSSALMMVSGLNVSSSVCGISEPVTTTLFSCLADWSVVAVACSWLASCEEVSCCAYAAEAGTSSAAKRAVARRLSCGELGLDIAIGLLMNAVASPHSYQFLWWGERKSVVKGKGGAVR